VDKVYQPNAIEDRWYQEWKAKGYFQPSEQSEQSFCIMIPPPNVTGTLHMGHAFNNTIMDGLTRYHRMCGDNTLWQPGTDHAGIATQMVVERQLNAAGQSRTELGREAFLEKVWDWKEESGSSISKQLERLGSSVDWSRERFTMDEGLSEAVREVFVRLYEEDLIYRGTRLVNWDPVLHTAVSDLEVVSEEEQGHLWHMRYPLADGSGHLVVATTRPETMLGDSAVAVHPEDERYQQLIGKTIRLPLTGREIPIIADDYVDPEFGSGCVKITPAHDFNDYEMGQRHDLAMLNIFTIDAKINTEAPSAYQGLDRYAARKAIIHDLEQLDLLEKIVDHKLMVPRGDRSGAVIEPFLTDQWYVKTESLAAPAIEAVESGKIRFVPDNWKNTYFAWMNDIQDWCISRQLWWGHRIPAWYDDQGKVYVGRDEAEVRSKYELASDFNLRQDEDVLDTWFSSALWPFSTLGWPQKTPELKAFYPTSVLVTGFDIIFFWVARMIMMGMKFVDDVPFHDIYIHGLVRDSDGQKMSKSKGNVLDPIDLIDGITLDELISKRTQGLMQPQMAAKIEASTRKQYPEGISAYGTDALRFTFAALASTGRDVKFDLNRIEGYRNFCNKLWNASRFVLMNCDDAEIAEKIDFKTLSITDRWILSRQQELIDIVHRDFQNYRFDLAAKALYEFTWNEFCDWYLELIKPVMFSDDEAAKRQTRRVLLQVLETLLRLMHPIIPFITEEIWQTVAPKLGKEATTIMLQDYPRSDNAWVDVDSAVSIDWLKEFIIGVRKIRSEMDIAPKQGLNVLCQQASENDLKQIKHHQAALKKVAKIESITLLENEEAPEAALALVGEMKVLIPLAGLIDKDAEIERLSKDISKLEINIGKTRAKLANPGFTDKAPAAVVEKEQQRVQEQEQTLHDLLQQREKMAKL
jgi:valyl-tRNA synthetase|tara:strand:- start:27398 stop:30157 length:2760 start_codon:yes stop_codon:yes gene_type:complete